MCYAISSMKSSDASWAACFPTVFVKNLLVACIFDVAAEPPKKTECARRCFRRRILPSKLCFGTFAHCQMRFIGCARRSVYFRSSLPSTHATDIFIRENPFIFWLFLLTKEIHWSQADFKNHSCWFSWPRRISRFLNSCLFLAIT